MTRPGGGWRSRWRSAASASRRCRLLEPQIRRNDRAGWRTQAFVLALTGDAAGAARVASGTGPIGTAEAMAPFLGRLPALVAGAAGDGGSSRRLPERRPGPICRQCRYDARSRRTGAGRRAGAAASAAARGAAAARARGAGRAASLARTRRFAGRTGGGSQAFARSGSARPASPSGAKAPTSSPDRIFRRGR